MIQWTDTAKPGHPYWWDHAAPVKTPGSLPDSCDVLIVGAGYTGLSAALVAHDGGARVCVVDAGVPGQGASTRNGGMFGAHPRLGWDALRQRFGADVADGVFAEAGPSLRFVQDIIARENIDCELQNTGRIQLAWSASHFEEQKRLAADVSAKSDVRIRVVVRDELRDEINTDTYFGGVVLPEHCAIHPAKFHQGLLAAVQRRGIPVVQNARVTAQTRDGATFRATTTKGEITADKVILATNGYTSRPFKWHQRRIFPLPSFIIATEPLSADRLAALAPGRRMMVETRARHSYFRLSPDRTRILFGGRAAMVDMDLHKAAARLHATMCQVWPSLSDVKLSHVWCGNTGYSFTHMPHVGVQDGMHFAMGFSGSGTVMAPYLGAKAAFQAMGDARGETAYCHTELTQNWMHRFDTPHFLKAADQWYRRVVDPLEWRKRFKG